MSLANFQEAFTKALFSAELDPALVAEIPHLSSSERTLKQFAAYRWRAWNGLTVVLNSVYPTASAAMGDKEFNKAGRAFFLQSQPRSVDPVLIAEPFGPFRDLYPTEQTLP